MRTDLLALLAAALLVGCEDPRRAVVATATAAPTASVVLTATASPTVVVTPTPGPVVRSRTLATADGPLQGWTVPPPTGVSLVDGVIQDILHGDATDIARRLTGHPEPCLAERLGLGASVVCPNGVTPGTLVPAIAAGGGCEWEWFNLDQYLKSTSQLLAGRQWLLVTAYRHLPGRPRPAWNPTYSLLFANLEDPKLGLNVGLDDQGIIGRRPVSWGSFTSCDTSTATLFTYPDVEYLIPRAP